jgi:hypothetical protein
MKRFMMLWAMCAVLLFGLAPKATAVDGDINRDGVVNFADFLILSRNYGASSSTEPVPLDGIYILIPEPGAGQISGATGNLAIADGMFWINIQVGPIGFSTLGKMEINQDLLQVSPVSGTTPFTFRLLSPPPDLRLEVLKESIPGANANLIFRWQPSKNSLKDPR